MEKNSLLTFIFSFMPGAGEMYLGMMKKGLAIMTAFFAVVFLGMALYMEEICVILPIIWCYSFFDTINMRKYSPEGRIEKDNKFGDDLKNFFGRDWSRLVQKKNTIFGVGFVLLGLYLLFENFVMPILNRFCDYIGSYVLYDVVRGIPSMVVAFLIILLGIQLLKGSKIKEEIKDEDLIEYEGDKDE
ncbi:MAG: hypothetical protein VB018_01875 [Lachnospiraceae bacterium]|nr:hypothetical protein [Lachnospiraceae bacterium]